MTKDLLEKLKESLQERADIERQLAERDKKDKKVISMYCAENAPADIYRTLKLLEKYNGLPEHDKYVVDNFNATYPKKLTVQLILEFEDVKDIYRRYLESGGNDDE